MFLCFRVLNETPTHLTQPYSLWYRGHPKKPHDHKQTILGSLKKHRGAGQRDSVADSIKQAAEPLSPLPQRSDRGRPEGSPHGKSARNRAGGRPEGSPQFTCMQQTIRCMYVCSRSLHMDCDKHAESVGEEWGRGGVARRIEKSTRLLLFDIISPCRLKHGCY